MIISYETFQFILNLAAVALVAAPIFHFLKSERGRNIVLGVAGSVLTFYIAPRLLIFFVLYWSVAWVLARVVATTVEKGKDPHYIAILSGVGLLLIPLLWWRLGEPYFVSTMAVYLNDFIGVFSVEVAGVDRSRTLMPVGLSFATFRAIDLLVKSYLGVEKPLRASEMFAYAFFPSVLVIGPIIERKEIAVHRNRRGGDFKLEDYWIGISQILIGLFKVFVISLPLEQFRAVVDNPAAYSTFETWVGLALFYFSFYLNFAGYSDMAIGFARLFGFKLLPNFNSPLIKGSPQEFWASWHMSLTRFAQRNVFVPLGGFRAKSRTLATALTMLTIALWHGVTFGLVIFGVYHTMGLLFWPAEPAEPTRGIQYARNAATFLFVMLSLPLLLTNLSGAGDVYKGMLGVLS